VKVGQISTGPIQVARESLVEPIKGDSHGYADPKLQERAKLRGREFNVGESYIEPG